VIAAPDEAHQKALAAYVRVEWRYDGTGAALKWANEHGNTNRDPAYLVWILDARAEVVSPWLDRKYVAEEFLAFLNDRPGAASPSSEKKKPLRVEFVDVAAREIDGAPRIEEIDKAREEGSAVLIYAQVPGAASGFALKGRSEEIKACRDWEKTTLTSAGVLELAGRFACFRIDLSRDLDRKFAARLGADSVPAVVVWPSGERPAQVFKKVSAKDLAAAMKEAVPE
jgi:hypothetical protein